VTDRKADVDSPIRCFSITLEHEECLSIIPHAVHKVLQDFFVCCALKKQLKGVQQVIKENVFRRN
jgi:hypothetical protein